MTSSLQDIKHVFFVGVAGAGMSAIAQYLAGPGKHVSGSDRFFAEGEYNDTKEKLESSGVRCFMQDGSGITSDIDLVIVSTAVEDSVPEVKKAMELHIPILKRSELLAMIAASKRTIAVGGTSGKSTTSAMLFDILTHAGLQPSIISGAGLTSIIRQGKIGNAMVGQGELLIIEADESDGSIVQYEPSIGLLLNIEKDHQEIDELMRVFTIFKNNTKELFIVNQSNHLAKELSQDINHDYSIDAVIPAGYIAKDFSQEGFTIHFTISDTPFSLNTIGKHNMENALAATAVAQQLGVDIQTCAEALKHYEGIYRRHQVLGKKNGVWVIDDFAHNPVKCAASIQACQLIVPKVIAWFQPHGYGPTRFLRNDFVKEIAGVLRPGDEIWMSEIFYAGGTTVKDISAADLVNDLLALGKNAFFVEDRQNLLREIKPHLSTNSVLLLMGARDPTLESFSRSVFDSL